MVITHRRSFKRRISTPEPVFQNILASKGFSWKQTGLRRKFWRGEDCIYIRLRALLKFKTSFLSSKVFSVFLHLLSFLNLGFDIAGILGFQCSPSSGTFPNPPFGMRIPCESSVPTLRLCSRRALLLLGGSLRDVLAWGSRPFP